jgi:hypothetical protein
MGGSLKEMTKAELLAAALALEDRVGLAEASQSESEEALGEALAQLKEAQDDLAAVKAGADVASLEAKVAELEGLLDQDSAGPGEGRGVRVVLRKPVARKDVDLVVGDVVAEVFLASGTPGLNFVVDAVRNGSAGAE